MIDKKNYSQLIFDYFFKEIQEGKIKPGDKLPNERALSVILGVSRPPLREALKSLSQIGLLTTRHGGGTYVNNYDSEFLGSILRYIMVLNDELINDLIQARKALEAEAAKLAAIYASETDLKNMEQLLIERENLVQQHKDDIEKQRPLLNDLDFNFHKAIAEASQNKVFLEFISAIRNTLTVHQNKAAMAHNMPTVANQYHRKIYEAIKNKNSDLAYKEMYEHIQSVEEAIARNNNQ